MIRVCSHCSNVDISELKKSVPEKIIEIGCIENCAAYPDKAYGYFENELIVRDNSEELVQYIKERL
ncbi:DUF1450 domain-containing protein [Wukongibacter baidiensis]|uniref:hypothetical protein n=1 Tax=Wukongibacter baidiensis TaxID=1723361 RepID=UPI003D7F8E80